MRPGRRSAQHRLCTLQRQAGVSYLFLLLLIFLISLGVGKTIDILANRQQRLQEEELIYVGSLYRTAIKDYYLSAPDGNHRYPFKLEDLLKDSRHLVTRRYLRQLYLDPITGRPFTPLYASQGGIWGVASSSLKQPIRSKIQADQKDSKDQVIKGESYRDWRFTWAPQ